MSKALEAAKAAVNSSAIINIKSDRVNQSEIAVSAVLTNPSGVARAAISTYLDHLSEDEAVVERVKTALEPYMAQPIIYQSVEGATLIALRALAGKE